MDTIREVNVKIEDSGCTATVENWGLLVGVDPKGLLVYRSWAWQWEGQRDLDRLEERLR